jgi:hypothetical protein
VLTSISVMITVGVTLLRVSISSLISPPTKEVYSSHFHLTSIRPVAQALVDNSPLQTDVVRLAADAPGPLHTDAVTALGIVVQVLHLERGIGAPANAAAPVADIAWTTRLPAPVKPDTTEQRNTGGAHRNMGGAADDLITVPVRRTLVDRVRRRHGFRCY